MSKAVTNEEVEDVLSSIRRLVSEDKRPLAGLSSTRRETAAKPVVEGAAAAGRLVLTPALRVAQTPETEVEPGPLDLGSVARETWTPSEDGPEAQDDSAPLVLRATEADDPAVGIDALVHETLGTQHDQDSDSLTDGDYSAEGYWDGAADEKLETDTSDDVDVHGRSADRNVSEKTGAARYDDSAPEVAAEKFGYSDEFDWEVEFATDDDEIWDVEPAQDEMAGDTSEVSLDPEPSAEIAVEQDASRLTADVPLMAKIAALGAAIGKSPDEWEPDVDEETDLSARESPAMDWEDDIELDAKGARLAPELVEDIAEAPKAEQEETAKPEVGAGSGIDDQLMDEDALRKLVSEIVRSELQGALGERITRNVRKLVRREIHRALTAQEME